MFLIPRKRIWTQQPQTAALLDPGHPLYRRIIGFWTASNPQRMQSAVVADALLTATGISKTTNPGGKSVNFGTYAGSSILLAPNTDLFRLKNTEATIIAGITMGAMASSTYQMAYCVRNTSSSIMQFGFGLDSGSYSGGRFYIGVGASSIIASPGSLKQSDYAIYGAEILSDRKDLYVNGELDTSAASAGLVAPSTINPSIGNRVGGGRAMSAGDLNFLLLIEGGIGDEWHRSLSARPYQVLKAPDARIFIPVSAGSPTGADLAGSVQGEASVTGALTLQAVLEGAALGVATVSGSLTTQIPLSGAVVAVASASGNLLTGIPLSGDIVGQSLASGSLYAQIQFDGDVLARAAIAAGLSTAMPLAGDVDGQASVSGALTAGSSGLEGAIAGQADIIATLTTSIKFSGSIAAKAGIEGVLTTAIPLTAEVLAQAIVSGHLSVPILLTGAIAGQASVAGTLSDTVPVVNYRLTPSLERLAHVRARADRLTLATATHARLATLTHGVAHV